MTADPMTEAPMTLINCMERRLRTTPCLAIRIRNPPIQDKTGYDASPVGPATSDRPSYDGPINNPHFSQQDYDSGNQSPQDYGDARFDSGAADAGAGANFDNLPLTTPGQAPPQTGGYGDAHSYNESTYNAGSGDSGGYDGSAYDVDSNLPYYGSDSADEFADPAISADYSAGSGEDYHGYSHQTPAAESDSGLQPRLPASEPAAAPSARPIRSATTNDSLETR